MRARTAEWRRWRLRSRCRNAAAVISDLVKRYKPEQITVGAGTVLDPETARVAILAGAQFLVSPALSLETARLANRYQVPYMPGADTVRDVIEAMECGADIIKVFPGEVLGPDFIRTVRAPLPQASLMPTGGVSIDNAATWIKAGAVALGVGGNLIAGAKTGDYAVDHRFWRDDSSKRFARPWLSGRADESSRSARSCCGSPRRASNASCNRRSSWRPSEAARRMSRWRWRGWEWRRRM